LVRLGRARSRPPSAGAAARRERHIPRPGGAADARRGVQCGHVRGPHAPRRDVRTRPGGGDGVWATRTGAGERRSGRGRRGCGGAGGFGGPARFCNPVGAPARRSRPPRGPRCGRAAACGRAVFGRTHGPGLRRAAGIARMNSERSSPPAGRPLRIALLTSNRFWRGASSVFAVLARGLAEHGHTTTAVVAYQPIADGFRERNLAVRVLPVGHTTLHGARALRRGLLDLAADIVLVDRARDIRLAAFRQRHGLGDRPILVAVGALEIEKRWDLLLESVALLPTPAPLVVLCGSGALDGALRAQAQRLGVDVRFVGEVDASQLVGAYN